MTDQQNAIREGTWRVLENTALTPNTYEMRLHCKDAVPFEAFQPGQFMHLRLPNAPHLLLRRPISVHHCDKAAQTYTLQYMVVGQGTEALAHLQVDDTLSAIAPVGNGFPLRLDGQGAPEKIWLLGGSLGSAPLYAIAEALSHAQIEAFLGWATATDVIATERWQQKTTLHTYTDDGTLGEAGFALDGLLRRLEQERPDVIYACGPMAMLQALAAQLPTDIACYVSLEARMGCGMGACLVCNCQIQTEQGPEHQRVCVDGPIYNLREVMF